MNWIPHARDLPGSTYSTMLTASLLSRDTTLEFMHALPPVVDRVMSCFALGLGFPEDFFKEVPLHPVPQPPYQSTQRLARGNAAKQCFAACKWHA